jgi:ABC-type methionine transport system permease subunit
MSCSDDNVYQGYPINLFGIVPASSVGSVIGIAWLGAVAVRYGFAPQLVQYHLIKALT